MNYQTEVQGLGQSAPPLERLHEIERLVRFALSAKGGLVILGLTAHQDAYKCAVAIKMHEMLEDKYKRDPLSITPTSLWLRDTLKHFGITHGDLVEGLNMCLAIQDRDTPGENA